MTDTVALLAGYVVVAFVVARWPVVVRDRRRSLVVLHTLAMAAVVGAWLRKGYGYPAAFNALWLLVSLGWYATARRTRRRRRRRPG